MVVKSKMITRLCCGFIAAIVLVGVAFIAYRTHERAGDAYLLILLAGSDEQQLSRNPFSRDGCPITPDLAVWILENFDYPYSVCSPLSRSYGVCGTPLILWAGRGLGISPPASDERLYRVLRHLIQRGEKVNVSHDGITALHEAVLFGKPAYAEILLNHGADPYIRIQRPDRKHNGLNAFEFADLLYAREPNRFEEVRAVLTELHKRHPAAIKSGTEGQSD